MEEKRRETDNGKQEKKETMKKETDYVGENNGKKKKHEERRERIKRVNLKLKKKWRKRVHRRRNVMRGQIQTLDSDGLEKTDDWDNRDLQRANRKQCHPKLLFQKNIPCINFFFCEREKERHLKISWNRPWLKNRLIH